MSQLKRKKRKKKIVLSGGGILVPLIFLGLAIWFWCQWNDVGFNVTEEHLEFIKEHINGRGEIVDYQNEIGVRSVEDIKLFVEGGIVKIEYGLLILTWDFDEFISDDLTNELKKIQLTRTYDTTEGKLCVYWRGQEVERYVS